MKTSIKKHLPALGLIIAAIGFVMFVGGFIASELVWNPGTPSELAQKLMIIAACGLPTAMFGMFVATID